MVKHDHNNIYVHKDVCLEKGKSIDIKLKNQQYQIVYNRDDIKAIKLKINATLTFAIVTLISILILYFKL